MLIAEYSDGIFDSHENVPCHVFLDHVTDAGKSLTCKVRNIPAGYVNRLYITVKEFG